MEETEIKGLLFSLDRYNICCPAKNMNEVILLGKDEVREIPGVRSLFRGLFIHRDDILPLLNLALLLQMVEQEEEIIPVGIMQIEDGPTFGLTISEETEIIHYESYQIEPMDRGPRGLDPRFFEGMLSSYGKMIFIIKVDAFRKYFNTDQK